MKKLFLLIFVLIVCSYVKAQTTITTATPLYPDSNNFAGGTVQAVFTPPTGIIDQNLYLLNGSPFPYIVTGTIDGSGQFTLTLTDDHIVRPLGGRWMFTVCSAASVPCTTSLQDVFGASIDLSSLITVDVKPIFGSPSYFPIYYEDSEIDNNINGGTEYFNFLSKTFRCWDGSTWSNCGGGGGGGGVSLFSAGNLTPIFTTSVTTPTSTPLLNFFLDNAPAHTVLANETTSSALPSYQTDALTINTTSPLTGGALVHLGGSITLDCPTCSVPQVSVTATSPIIVTPSPGISTFVISCPTCGTDTGTVTNFSSGNLSPLFTTSVSNPTTTPNLTFALNNAAANTVFGNLTGGSTLPSFSTTSIAESVPTGFTTSGTPIINLNGTLTWGMPTGWTTGDLLLGNGSNSVSRLLIGTNTYVLTSNGTTASWQPPTSGGGASKVPFDSCDADKTITPGSTYWRRIPYTATGVTSVDMGTWEYTNSPSNPAGTVICKSEVPSNASGTIHVFLDLASLDTTAGHTAAFKIGYACSSSQNINNLTYTITSTQNYVSTTTAYANTRLDFTTTSCTIGEYFIANIIQNSGGTNTQPIRMISKVKWF